MSDSVNAYFDAPRKVTVTSGSPSVNILFATMVLSDVVAKIGKLAKKLEEMLASRASSVLSVSTVIVLFEGRTVIQSYASSIILHVILSSISVNCVTVYSSQQDSNS